MRHDDRAKSAPEPGGSPDRSSLHAPRVAFLEDGGPRPGRLDLGALQVADRVRARDAGLPDGSRGLSRGRTGKPGGELALRGRGSAGGAGGLRDLALCASAVAAGRDAEADSDAGVRVLVGVDGADHLRLRVPRGRGPAAPELDLCAAADGGAVGARSGDLHFAVSVKNRLRVLRAELSWSQAELAEKLGVSRQTVNAIETGKYDPSLPLAFSMARTFKRRIEEIFEADGIPGLT